MFNISTRIIFITSIIIKFQLGLRDLSTGPSIRNKEKTKRAWERKPSTEAAAWGSWEVFRKIKITMK